MNMTERDRSGINQYIFDAAFLRLLIVIVNNNIIVISVDFFFFNTEMQEPI